MFSFLSAEPSTRKRKTKCLIAGEGGRVGQRRSKGWTTEGRCVLPGSACDCQSATAFTHWSDWCRQQLFHPDGGQNINHTPLTILASRWNLFNATGLSEPVPFNCFTTRNCFLQSPFNLKMNHFPEKDCIIIPNQKVSTKHFNECETEGRWQEEVWWRCLSVLVGNLPC